MKILYCCQHPASLLKAICHKLEFYKNDEALILIEGECCADLHNIRSLSYIEYSVIFNSNSEEHLITKLNNYIKEYLEKYCINLSDFDHIYCIWDVNHIWSLYFTLNSISYNLIEFADNQIDYYNSEKFKTDRLNKNLGRYFFDLLSVKYSIFSENNNNIKTIQYNSHNSRIPNIFKNTKITNTFTDDYQNKIINSDNHILKELYGILDFHAPSDIVLLTNSMGYTVQYLRCKDRKQFFNWTGANTDEENDIKAQNAAFFYLLTIDYLLKDREFCIKFHPASGKLEKLISNEILVKKNIPFEIIQNDFPTSLCFLFTNALNHVENSKKMVLGVNYSQLFYSIPFIFWSLNIFKTVDDKATSILINGVDTNLLNNFLMFSNSNQRCIEFSEKHNYNDRYIFLKNYYIFESNFELVNLMFDLMNNDSIIIFRDQFDNIFNSLDNKYYINVKCEFKSRIFKFNKPIEYYTICFKNIYNYIKIINACDKFRNLNLKRSKTSIDIDIIYSTNMFKNILDRTFLLSSIINNENGRQFNIIHNKIQEKFEFFKLFSSQLLELKKTSDDNLICLIDDNNNLIRVDSVNSCSFVFRGKNNVIILHKDNQFVNCRFEASDNCLYIIKKSRSKISLNLCNWTNPNIKFLIDNDFCCSSTCKITLPNSDSYIGKECMFSYGIEIRATDGHTIFDNQGNIIRKHEYLYIGNHVWVGCHARILKNTFIQNNSIVGMNAVVKGNYFNHGSVLAGNPAKVVRCQALWSRHQNNFFENC